MYTVIIRDLHAGADRVMINVSPRMRYFRRALRICLSARTRASVPEAVPQDRNHVLMI